MKYIFWLIRARALQIPTAEHSDTYTISLCEIKFTPIAALQFTPGHCLAHVLTSDGQQPTWWRCSDNTITPEAKPPAVAHCALFLESE